MTSAEECYATIVHALSDLDAGASDRVLAAVLAYGHAVRAEVLGAALAGIPTPRSGIKAQFREEVLSRAAQAQLRLDRAGVEAAPASDSTP